MLHELLSGKLLDPFFWRFKKLDVYGKYKKYILFQYTDLNNFQYRQRKSLSLILEHALTNVVYYKNLKPTLDLSLLNEDPFTLLKLFPIMSKDTIKNDLDSLYVELSRGTFINTTGGSTGRPVKFYQDKNYLVKSIATTFLMYEWAQKLPGDKHVKLWGAERDLIDGKIGFKHMLLDFISNRITLNSFSMSPETMRTHLKCINKTKPVLLEGYADSLFEIARFAREHNISCFKPGAIVSSAGTLYMHMRELIEDVFNCEVYDRYGSREAGNMAAECDMHQGLHVFGETTIIEVVDNDGDEVNVGEEGRILVTNLTNYTMPLIRYDIGDRAVKGKNKCDCGRPYPLLEKIVGRQTGSFKGLHGGVVSSALFIHCIGVMCNDGSVDKFQAIQKSLNEIIIKIKPFEYFNLDNWPMKKEITNIINKAMGGVCDIQFVFVDDIPLTPTGKHIYTICELDNE